MHRLTGHAVTQPKLNDSFFGVSEVPQIRNPESAECMGTGFRESQVGVFPSNPQQRWMEETL
jgi:hypothetical protein